MVFKRLVPGMKGSQRVRSYFEKIVSLIEALKATVKIYDHS